MHGEGVLLRVADTAHRQWAAGPHQGSASPTEAASAGETSRRTEVRDRTALSGRAAEFRGAARDVEMRMRSYRRFIPWVVMIGVAGAAALWVKPWADSVMTAKVIVATDDGAPAIVYEMRRRFSEAARRLPVFRTEIDLGQYAGQLLRFDVEGNIARREVEGGSTGYVACEAELASPEGVRPLEFVGWQQGPESGLHYATVGPLSCRLEGEEDARFAFARKGTLWYALRVPTGARLRLRLRPVPSVGMGRRPEAYLPPAGQSDPRARLPARPKERPPDVFIYVIDALRADHLGCYGYHRPTSPVMDAFAAEAAFYEDGHAATTWTRPSVATMLSGLYACVHGAMHESDGLAEWPVLLSEMLQEAGYRTRFISSNGNIRREFGFDQGFDEFIFVDQASARRINSMVGRRLASEEAEKPVFMYLHTVEPHGPYAPGPEAFRRFDRGFKGECDGSQEALDALDVLYPDLSPQDVEHLIDLYDAEVYEADQGVAEFLSVLKRAGRYENSLIVLVSDHGEAFTEHDTMGHGWELNQEDMHVLLIVKYPEGRQSGVRVKERVSLVDLMPTILAEVGLRPRLGYRLAGRDVSTAATGPGRAPGRCVYGETAYWDSNDLDLVGVIDEDGYKRVIDLSVPPRENATKKSLGLWDTGNDRAEKVDLIEKMPVRAAYDEQLIAHWLVEQRAWREASAAGPPPKIELSDELRRELQGMGYVRGGASAEESGTP